jgi:membrane protein implicated in regulation of membrane protease activity
MLRIIATTEGRLSGFRTSFSLAFAMRKLQTETVLSDTAPERIDAGGMQAYNADEASTCGPRNVEREHRMLRGIHGIFAHHGFLWFVLILSGVALAIVAILVAVGVIAPLAAALTFAGVSVTGALLALAVALSIRHQPLPATVRLLGSRATVVQPLAPQGRVLVHGEDWAASLADPFVAQTLPAGQTVRVLGVVDLQLIVAPEAAPLPSPSAPAPAHS